MTTNEAILIVLDQLEAQIKTIKWQELAVTPVAPGIVLRQVRHLITAVRAHVAASETSQALKAMGFIQGALWARGVVAPDVVAEILAPGTRW